MKASNVPKYYSHLNAGRNGKAHDMAHSNFNTYLFQLSGSKFLLHKLIQLPLLAQLQDSCTSDAHPESLVKCIQALQEYKKSDEYKKAVEKSQKRGERHVRLSQQIWVESKKLAMGRRLSEQAKKGRFFELDESEQTLVEDYDGGKIERNLRLLMSYKTATYRGVCASTPGP